MRPTRIKGEYMKKILPQLLHMMLIAFIISIAQSAEAQIKHGDETVYVGESTTISLGSAYQSTLARATGISYRWSSSSAISVTSSTKNYATIKGLSATTSGKVYYYCSYYIDGYYRTMDFYWDVVVKNSTIYVTSVSLSQTSATITEGNSLSLSASVYPSNATNRSVTWSSSSSSVASVSSSGVVYGNSAGTATITCRAADGSGCYANCYVTVKSISPTSVSIPATLTLKNGASSTITPTLYPSNAKTTYTWTSSNASVATVNSSGKVTAKGVGTARITVETANGLSDYCDVTVERVYPTSITLSSSEATIEIGKSKTLTYSLNPTGATAEVIWESESPNIATVTQNGVVTATSAGVTNITVTTDNGMSATCKIIVPAVPESISLPKELKLGLNKKSKLNYQIQPSDAVTTISWGSDNSEVATVDNDGFVTAVGIGEANITVATSNGKTATCHVIVPTPEHNLIVWTYAGETFCYLLSERPKVTQTTSSLVLTTTKTEVEYSKDDVWKFTMQDLSAEAVGIENIRTDNNELTQCDNVVYLSNCRAGTEVRIYSVSGVLYYSQKVSEDGSLEINLNNLNSGVYIISTESITYKIIKR